MTTDTIKAPTARKQLLLVEVFNRHDPKYGAAVRDAEARWMPLDKASRFDPNLRKVTSLTPPVLSEKAALGHPTQQDNERMIRYNKQLAAMPTVFAVQRMLGRTFQNAGFWLISGDDILDKMPFEQDRQGAWQERKGVEWVAGPYLSIAEARAEHPELPPADIGPAPVKTETAEVRKLREDNMRMQREIADMQKENAERLAGDHRAVVIANYQAAGVPKEQAEMMADGLSFAEAKQAYEDRKAAKKGGAR